jgi:hypothetical protein
MHVYTLSANSMSMLQFTIKDYVSEAGVNKQIYEDSAHHAYAYLKTPKTYANKPMINHNKTKFLIFLAFSRE